MDYIATIDLAGLHLEVFSCSSSSLCSFRKSHNCKLCEVSNWHQLVKCFQNCSWTICLKLKPGVELEVEQWSIHVFILGRFAKHDETDMMMIINSNYFVRFGKKTKEQLIFSSIASKSFKPNGCPIWKSRRNCFCPCSRRLSAVSGSKWVRYSKSADLRLSWAPTAREVFWRRSTKAEQR